MMRGAITFMVTLGVLHACQLNGADPTPSGELLARRTRAAVESSLTYLEHGGVSWIETKKCVSCHRISFLTWTMNEASRKGLEVDLQKLRGWLDWSVARSLEPKADGTPVDGALNLDGVAQLLMADVADTPGSLTPEQVGKFVELLLRGQEQDGSWKPCGQLPGQKREQSETVQVSTMWNTFALGQQASTDQIETARRRALLWLERIESGKSTEWYAVRLLLYQQLKDEPDAQRMCEQLRSKQNADGGWGWLVGDKSDALATGQAIYALAKVHSRGGEASLLQAQQFLIDTQQKDGSWTVRGTKESKKNNIEETACYWGTAWATLGLLQLIP